MLDAMGQRQNNDNANRAADTRRAWPNYLPAVIAAGVLAFIMAWVTVMIVNG